MSVDPYPDMEPFPFADLFTHGWVQGDLTPEGGVYLVVCQGCQAHREVRGIPRTLPDITHETPCPVADYIADPAGGIEGRMRIHAILRADEGPPQGRIS